MAFLPPPLPPPLPVFGPVGPAAQYEYFSSMTLKQLANCIHSLKIKIGELYEYLQYAQGLAGSEITPTPDTYVGIPATKPFPEETTPSLPGIRSYRVDGSIGREIWNTHREIGGEEGMNRGYADFLVPMYEILQNKMKTEAIARRSPALLAWWRARHAPV